MKNKEKFIKIANIISKVLIGIMIALLVLCVCVVCFRACTTDKQVAYASETDGIGTWVWNDNLISPPELTSSDYMFTFVSNNTEFELCSYLIDTAVVYVNNSSAIEVEVWKYDIGWTFGFDSPYRTIDIKTAPSAEFLTILQTNATYQGGSTPEPVSYTVTKQSVGCSIIGADTVELGQSYTYQIAPNTGYNYPDTVSVLGANYTYDKNTGKIIISDITGNVTINVRAAAKTFNVTFNVSNATVTGDTVVESGGSYVYQITPSAGYTFPSSVSVVGATLVDYGNTTGRLEIQSPSANVIISGSSPLIVNPVNTVRGKYTFLNVVSIPDSPITQLVRFTTTNGSVVSSYDRFVVRLTSTNEANLLYRLTGSSNEGVIAYDVNGGWRSPQFQVIDFGSDYQDVSADFYNWLVDNTVPPNVEDSESYQIGYNAGLAVGQSTGYTSGYNAGQSFGYNQGYQAGLAEGQNNALHGAEGVIAGTASLFDIKIFGAFSILDMLLVVFGIGVAIWFLKMFAGG